MSPDQNDTPISLEEDVAGPIDGDDTASAQSDAVEEAVVALEESPSPEAAVTAEAELQESADEFVPIVTSRRGVNPNLTLATNPFVPMKDRKDLLEPLSLFGYDADEINQFSEQFTRLRLPEGESVVTWLRTLEESELSLPRPGNAFHDSLNREGGDWRQGIAYNGETLQVGRPKQNARANGELTGDKAVMKMQTLMQLGSPSRIPLWHSGFWVNFKAPTELALLELDRKIAAAKVELGRETRGLVFSNQRVYMDMPLVDFALAHIYDSSLKYESTAEIKSAMLMTDIPTLLMGLAVSIYPNGYPYRQACVVNPHDCRHIVQELLNLSKLFWTDRARLSEKQLKHMSERGTSKHTVESLRAYQEEHKYGDLATVELSPAIRLGLRVPTVQQYETMGHRWIDSIVDSVSRSFTDKVDPREREEYMNEQARVTTLRQYAHWVSKIVLVSDGGDGEVEEVVEHMESIESMVATMTSNLDIHDAFFKGVGDFINGTTFSLIGIPKYNCPACGKPQPNDERVHPHLIVLEVANVFFTLVGQRVSKVLQHSRW